MPAPPIQCQCPGAGVLRRRAQMLTAFVDGQPVLRAADTALTEGTVGVGAIGPSKVYFSEIDLFIPNKVSFVVDRRTSLAPSKGRSPATSSFRPRN